MRPAHKRPTAFVQKSFLAIVLISLFLTFLGCQRTTDKLVQNASFSTETVKEWYYETFKKSPEWSRSAQKGKKLPDWKYGIYKKNGAMELIEFPLVQEITTIGLLNPSSMSASDRKRIAAASLTRIVFIKKGDGLIDVREVDYIPEWDFLQRKAFDISSVAIGKDGNDFSGKLVIKTWDGYELSRWTMRNGKLSKRLSLMKRASQNSSMESFESQSTCEGELCHYVQQCWAIFANDRFVSLECGEWELDYCENVQIECEDGDGSSDDDDSCAGLSDEECYCQLYGVGCGDGDGDDGGGNETCIASSLDEGNQVAENFLNEISTSNETKSITTDYSDPYTRSRHYEWVFMASSWGEWTSHDTSLQVKGTDGLWRFSKLSHVTETSNSSAIGFSVDYELKNVRPYLGQFNSSIRFDSEVTTSFVFKGCPIKRTQTLKCGKIFLIDDGD